MSASSTAVAYETISPLSFDDAVARAREVLAGEGFGVVTEIDVKATFKKKLGVDVPPFLILGACHAPSAHRALQAAPEVGVLLPCNVTVSVEEGKTVIRAMNPEKVMALVGKPDLAPIGGEVGEALRRIVRACESR
jgi:uncharacterized protein (DUF302 family)